jgi:3-deoxy-7-phosphoheptulonate synthase/chorismate mutase
MPHVWEISAPMPDRIEHLRKRVDALNTHLLELVQERAEIVLEISRLKEELGLDSYDPRREEEMLQRLTANTSGPFGPAEIRSIFRAIFRASLGLQERARERTRKRLSRRAAARSEAAP